MKIYTEFLFWLHVGIIIGAVSLGYFLPPLIILVIIVAHQLHIKIYNGCILSLYQRKVKGLPESDDFIQYAIYRMTGKKVSRTRANLINYVILLSCLSLSLYRFGFKLY